MRSCLLILILIGCIPAAASAVTIDEIVALSKSGVSEQVIVALIERDQTLYALSPALIMKLQREGLSDPILLALIKSGRPNEPPAPPSTPVLTAAAVPPPPAVAVVSHAPEPPNRWLTADAMTAAEAPPFAAIPAPVFVPVPVIVPVPSPSHHEARLPHRRPEPLLERSSANPLLCVERVSTGSSPFAPALTRVTECPAVMQRYRDIR